MLFDRHGAGWNEGELFFAMMEEKKMCSETKIISKRVLRWSKRFALKKFGRM